MDKIPDLFMAAWLEHLVEPESKPATLAALKWLRENVDTLSTKQHRTLLRFILSQVIISEDGSIIRMSRQLKETHVESWIEIHAKLTAILNPQRLPQIA